MKTNKNYLHNSKIIFIKYKARLTYELISF